jgi:hypothetical protein
MNTPPRKQISVLKTIRFLEEDLWVLNTIARLRNEANFMGLRVCESDMIREAVIQFYRPKAIEGDFHVL